MNKIDKPQPVTIAFERETRNIPTADITPLRLVTDAMMKSQKYEQIRASVLVGGLVELPVVAQDRSEHGKYLLLDGHLRLAALHEMGATEVECLIATDDEAYTYNKRINRLAIIQEHQMILNAVERGVPEEVIAKVLNVNVANIRMKRRLLTGICSEAVELLKDKHVPMNAFTELRKMKPLRQIEAAQLMVAMNKYSIAYAKSLVGATPPSQLVEGAGPKNVRGLTDEQIALMEQESEKLDREFRLLEETYGDDHLELVIATGYVKRLIENARVVRHMAQHYPELLMEFQKITEPNSVSG
ncbi:plasmid partitioning protein RepB C-terminal domain-containing protein [Devosia sp. SD17-2]|uniref:plasmid partitioning protein RepB C-terminal domain-containing protein n=1 Tax=Devosia sp. SD17-2 TaxID=2976459 RepID=UPI0023D89A35|nr:plasmid partitioning protein RepB C-terminal domain-containing protein [Devosia sp. SD17-2]WEJ32834.1 ParB N-terminal domain-containing protein [Devosia sp. SD17-2]